jgi:hypothetical protein
VNTVKVCVVLHNFVRKRDGYEFEVAMAVTSLEDVKSINGGLTPNNVRDKAVDYFLTDARAVPWQM